MKLVIHKNFNGVYEESDLPDNAVKLIEPETIKGKRLRLSIILIPMLIFGCLFDWLRQLIYGGSFFITSLSTLGLTSKLKFLIGFIILIIISPFMHERIHAVFFPKKL